MTNIFAMHVMYTFATKFNNNLEKGNIYDTNGLNGR